MTKSPENIITLPAWLDALRQPDEKQAAAYEACPSDFRASLKTAIAFAFHLWGESASVALPRGYLHFCPRTTFLPPALLLQFCPRYWPEWVESL